MNWSGFLKSKAHWWIFLTVAFIAFFHCLALGQAYFVGDLLAQYSRFRALLRLQLAEGHFPLWNPYFFGGQPFFADLNVMMAYPLLYPTLLFSIPYGLGVYYALHMVLAALGMHGWLKALRLPDVSCRLFALVFALSGFFWWEVIHPPILAAFAWFPLMMWALERLCQRPTPGRAFGAGLSAAMLFVCGNFQMTSCFFYTGLFYFLGRLWLAPGAPAGDGGDSGRRWAWKTWARVLGFGFWGALPLVFLLVPVYEFAELSNRTEASLGYDNFNSQFSLQPQSLYQLFFPTLGVPPGRTIEECLAPVSVDIAYMGVYGFLGVWIPLLAVNAFRRKEKKLLYFFLALSALSVLTALGKYFPLHRILCDVLPTIKYSRVPGRYIAVYDAFTTILAAFGYQALEKGLSEKERHSPTWLAGGLTVAFFLFLISWLRPDESWPEMTALVLGSAGLALWGFTQSWKPLGRGLFQAALILPLFLNGWTAGYGWGPVSNYDLESHFPAFTYLKEHSKACRYYFDMSLGYPVDRNGRYSLEGFPVDSPLELGIRMSNGYNPIVLKDTSEMEKLPMNTYLRLMAVQGLLFGRDQGESKDFVRQVFPNNTYLYEMRQPPPYVNAPSQVAVVPDPAGQLAALGNQGFDPASQVVLSESLPSSIASQLDGQRAQVNYDIEKDDPDDEVFKVQLDKNSLLTFSEIMYPGWRALLDGQPAPLFTADHVFRAVYVPAGGHEVEFSYQPSWAKPSLLAAVLWFFSAVGFGAYLLKQRGSKVEPAQV